MRKINTFLLHILAMSFMLCDHLWATVVPGNQWLTCIGRLAFPLFAFLLVEGFFHTHDRRKYAFRLFFFALLSEIPFNFMYGSRALYPYHQNVLWTFLLAFGCMALVEAAKKQGKLWLTVLTSAAVTILGAALGTLLMVDYFGFGVLTVLVFYFFRGKKWYHFAGQLLFLWLIHGVAFGGLLYPVSLFGMTFFLPQQGLAVLSLPFIWLYNGERGPHSKGFQYACYAFYPLHMAVLAAIYLMR